MAPRRRLTAEGPIGRDVVGAVTFYGAANMAYQAFGTLNSSPWTTENVGADEEKVRSMFEYVAHAVVSSIILAGVGAYAARSWWPLVGVLLVDLYLTWIYRRAAARGFRAGSVGAGWFDTWGRRAP